MSGNSYVYDPNPNYFDCPPDSYHPPHPTYETYSYDSYENDSQFGYDCQPQFLLHYESEPGYNENYNSYPYGSSSLPQQYLCCAYCGGPHETCQCDQLIFDEPYCKHCGGPHMNYQCQPMNQDSYNSNCLGFDQPQPPQSPVIHQLPQELSIQEMEDLKQQYSDELKCLSNLEYRDEIKIAESWKILMDYTSAITPDETVLSTEEPDNSLSMGDEHLDTISATPIPSESEGIPEHMCDVLSHDNSPPLDVSDDQFEDLSDSEVMEIVIPKLGGIEASNDNPIPFYDLIIYGTPQNLTPSGESDFFLEGDMLLLEAFLNDDHYFDFKTKPSSTSLNSLLEETNNFDNSLPEFTTFLKVLCDAEYKFDSSDNQSCSDEDVLEKIVSKPLSEEEIIPMKSLRTHDSFLPISSKIDSLLHEFADELNLLKSISPGIDETDCDFEEDIRLIEKLLYDNSSPLPPEEFVSANSDAESESFSPSPILVKDSDFLMEEMDLFCTPNYPMPSALRIRIMTLKGIFSFLRTCLAIIPFHLLKKSHFILIFLCFLVLLQNHQMEKPPDLLSHRCGTVKKFNTCRSHLNGCPMLIHGQNNPPLDVLLFHFYPP
nr:hypothetical protein [Tanacetum cinerariifolium]